MSATTVVPDPPKAGTEGPDARAAGGAGPSPTAGSPPHAGAVRAPGDRDGTDFPRRRPAQAAGARSISSLYKLFLNRLIERRAGNVPMSRYELRAARRRINRHIIACAALGLFLLQTFAFVLR